MAKWLHEDGERYVIDWRDRYGRQRRKTLPKGVDEATADKIEQAHWAAARTRAKITAEGRTIAEFIDGYIKWSEQHQSPQTARDKRSSMKKVKKIIGDVYLTEFSNEHIGIFKTMRLAEGAGKRTINKQIDYIRAMFNKYLSEELGILEPLAFRTRKLAVKRPIPRVMSREEVYGFLGALEEESCNLTLFLLMYGIGLRLREATTLRWENVDLTTGTLHVVRKGNKHQALPVAGWPLEMLMQINHGKTEGWVFPSRTSSTGHVMELRRVIKRAKRRAGIPEERKINPHLFRHSIATQLVTEGVDFRIIQQLLGHESITTTMFYGQVATEALRKYVPEFKRDVEINNGKKPGIK